MSRPIPLAAVVAAAALAACSANPAPVPVAAAPSELSSLAGEWRGEYRAEETGRSGGIFFVVEPGSDTAHGDVLMAAPGTELPYRMPPRADRPAGTVGGATGPADAGPRVLRISFVRVAEGVVRGDLEPYEAPDCRCVVNTSFEGRMAGDRIEGTFVTRGARGAGIQRGRWRVSRKGTDGGSR